MNAKTTTGVSIADRLRLRAATAAPMAGELAREIPLERIRFDTTQPRKGLHPIDGNITQADMDGIAEMAESIKHQGLIQPIVVREMDDGSFLVVVGERRTRAHLQLGYKTIAALVHNKLTDPAHRLLFQLAENVNRENLSDDEIAASIQELLKGSDTTAPMSQSNIAKTLGKSEGWVTRFVRFGDEELRRLWVTPGIADTPEKLYRLSILPKWVQVDLLRRVGLPEEDPDHLAKPLLRAVIDAAGKEAKIAKRLKEASPPTMPVAPGPVTLERQAAAGEDGGAGEQGGDEIGRLLGKAVTDGYVKPAGVGATPENSILSAGQYQLPAEARAAILGTVPAASAKANSPGTAQVVPAPVNCRVSLANVVALIASMQSNDDLRGEIERVRCDLSFPGPVAQLLANALTGVVVDHREVPATVQNELSKR